MKLILIGIQGSGKSTQGNLLKERFDVPYLSTGHIFRELAKEHTPEGRFIKETMHSGLLISDSRTMRIVTEYLSRPEYENGYLLDGFPRTLKQAEDFDHDIDAVIYLDVPDKEALWRLSHREGAEADGRDDETLAAVRKRIELFHEHTEPVLHFYKRKHKLIEVDGMRKIDEIHKDVVYRVLQVLGK